MSYYPSIWSNALAHLKCEKPEQPVLYFAPSVLRQTVRDFQAGFPGLVSYATKANDTPAVLENLIAAGVRSFDVASPAEIHQVRGLDANAALHYNNPVRSPAEIAEAVAAGVISYSVDSPGELQKLTKGVRPENIEIAVRLRLPVKGAVYDFGEKFGADPRDAIGLLKVATAAGFTPSMTFHPGTQCADPAAWRAYIRACAEVAQQAGISIKRLNVGGGFPANRGRIPDLSGVFSEIKQSVTGAFGESSPSLVCEPGRALVAEAFTLASQVKAIRPGGAVFLNDGIYGSFGEAMNPLGVVDRLSTISRTGDMHTGQVSARVIYGPTCDSIDRLPGEYPLPADLAEGDYLLFQGMGAYSTATMTRFNGYGATQIITVQSDEI